VLFAHMLRFYVNLPAFLDKLKIKKISRHGG